MTTVRELHDKAIHFANLVIVARQEGDDERARNLARQAYELESQAASQVPLEQSSEPTRSILYRSAASFAMQCDELQEARRLIALGLSGFPPPKVEKDLLDLFEEVGFRMYLLSDQSKLEVTDLSMAIRGRSVGSGSVLYNDFRDRVEGFYTLVNRTVERLMGRDYQRGGRRSKTYRPFQRVLEIPATQNSFAITLKFIRLDDTQTSFLVDAPKVIDDIVVGVRLLNEGQEEQLRAHIKNEAYFTNFVNTARVIAPDGEKISYVGFRSHENSAELTRSKSDINVILAISDEEREAIEYNEVTVEGILNYADGTTKRKSDVIGLEVENGDVKYIVPSEGIDDLVLQYWKQRVTIAGKTDGKYIYPTDITPLEN